ncbi:hypothetical protein UCRPC4_g03170 [Phaeomoniella chlamydospora]|uniref:Uncharacterized protein n=1 Tax=Phaeomoniella chlamydospora TaxID=158046 RepID=A0A0G2GGB3_PHACM|nr:hypothetical protein UCRPC4_g03170 [Phaeomoniella chlamydospora]
MACRQIEDAPLPEPIGSPPPYSAGPPLNQFLGPCYGSAPCPLAAPVAQLAPVFWVAQASPAPPVTPQPNKDIQQAPPAAQQAAPVANNPDYPIGGRLNGNGIRFPDGAGYLFPELNCRVNLIEKDVRPWNRPGQSFKWHAFWVPIRCTINELIRQAGAKVGARAESFDTDFSICETKEMGDGAWLTGTQYKLGELKSAGTLESVGWDEGRDDSNPVWLAVLTS